MDRAVIRPIAPEDEIVAELLEAQWGSRGDRIVAVHADAISKARKLKPQIPLVGQNGIPIRDEIELEKRLPAPEEALSG